MTTDAVRTGPTNCTDHAAEQVDARSPSRALDRTFRVSVILKGLDGALEIIGGLLLLLVSPATIQSIVRSLTQHELSEDPHDLIASHLLRSTRDLSHATALFAAVYLLSHGVAKVVLVIAVLRDQIWAYPAIIVLLIGFIIYQLYRLRLEPDHRAHAADPVRRVRGRPDLEGVPSEARTPTTTARHQPMNGVVVARFGVS